MKNSDSQPLPVVECSVVIQNENKLLLKQSVMGETIGKPSFPIGRPQVGETVVEAAQRIAFEATGFHIQLTEVMSIHYFVWAEGKRAHIYFNFWAALEYPLVEAMELPENTHSIQWKTPEELKEMIRGDRENNREFGGPHTSILAREALQGSRYPLSILGPSA